MLGMFYCTDRSIDMLKFGWLPIPEVIPETLAMFFMKFVLVAAPNLILLPNLGFVPPLLFTARLFEVF